METLLFVLTPEDKERIDEISLPGVIAGKLAMGDYKLDSDLGRLTVAYEQCNEVNNNLHKKINAIRKVLLIPRLDLAEEIEHY